MDWFHGDGKETRRKGRILLGKVENLTLLLIPCSFLLHNLLLCTQTPKAGSQWEWPIRRNWTFQRRCPCGLCSHASMDVRVLAVVPSPTPHWWLSLTCQRQVVSILVAFWPSGCWGLAVTFICTHMLFVWETR
jgi:hypothetical protein